MWAGETPELPEEPEVPAAATWLPDEPDEPDEPEALELPPQAAATSESATTPVTGSSQPFGFLRGAGGGPPSRARPRFGTCNLIGNPLEVNVRIL